MAAQTGGGSRPSHIVVFNKPSPENASTLKRILKVKDHAGASLRSGIQLLTARRVGGSLSRVYNRLAVATLDLEENDSECLVECGGVAGVFKNETRSIPKPVQAAASGGTIHSDPVINYVRGMRDMASLLLGRLGAESLDTDDLMGGTPVIRQRAERGRTHSWALEMIGIGPEYSRFTGKGIKVAVLDTGIDLGHPDFTGRLTDGDNAVSFVMRESVQDGHGHGSHCAGVVGGPRQSAGGRRYGVAPDVQLLIGKVLSNAGTGYDDQIIDAIDWANDAGARVISMSLGSVRDVNGRYATLYENIGRVLLDSNPGALIVAAAGNESARPHYTQPVGNPAACPSFMSVAATDENRGIAAFSCRKMDNIGEVDISAPGVSIFSAWANGRFWTDSGTSMATPHVAGVAALYIEQDPNATAREVWQKLQRHALPAGAREDFGAGIVQAPS